MNKFSRQIRGLRQLAKRLRPGSVPGALVDVTTGGTFVRQIGNRRGNNRTGGGGPSRWM